MPYAEGRVVHDADSHVMETPDWLVPYADPGVRARLKPLFVGVREAGRGERHRRSAGGGTPTRRTRRAEAEIMLRKNWSALGSFVKEDRPRALDLLGFSSQLVFNTFLNQYLCDAEHGRRPRLRLRPGARPQPRHRRLLLASTGACSPSATCRSPTSRAHAPWPRRRIAHGLQGACSSRRPARPGTRRATSACSRCGRSRRRRGCRSSSTSAAAAGCSTRTTSTTACRRSPTSTAGRRTSARSTTWRSPSRRCRRWRR